jgi:hypothetical protein
MKKKLLHWLPKLEANSVVANLARLLPTNAHGTADPPV